MYYTTQELADFLNVNVSEINKNIYKQAFNLIEYVLTSDSSGDFSKVFKPTKRRAKAEITNNVVTLKTISIDGLFDYVNISIKNQNSWVRNYITQSTSVGDDTLLELRETINLADGEYIVFLEQINKLPYEKDSYIDNTVEKWLPDCLLEILSLQYNFLLENENILNQHRKILSKSRNKNNFSLSFSENEKNIEEFIDKTALHLLITNNLYSFFNIT